MEVLLPVPLAAELREEREQRANAIEAEYRVREERRREEAAARANPVAPSPIANSLDRVAFIRAFERGLAHYRRNRRHPVLQAEELLRVMERISTLRDKDNQKRELELTKRLERAGALREIVNPAFRPVRWATALEYLRSAHPHFGEVTEFVARRVALSTHSRHPLTLPPLHLWGEPGLGKTHYANDLAQGLGAPLRRHSMENAQTTSLLLGTERHWSTASQGLIFDQICLGTVANPVFLIDELDKAPKGSQYDPLAPLHSLLEPVTACRIRDASLDIEFDASLATYIATSNDPGKVQESLRSRFREFHVLAPTGAQALQAAHVVTLAAVRQLNVRGFAMPEPALCHHVAHLTAREIFQVVQDAVARAVAAGRRHLTLADLPEDSDPSDSRHALH
ncbi:AAA family ATPase [Variovorax sp. J2P1-59]|uniref:AAA family ATPase n=1 Tax=Variovorax flavidus TaxID=3053501 RepID=UPI0025751278|nr:AAA family ATPase [Variovorax sp. J2P1-59]MDM0075747.1 AAA family ATPase [Variovorax sp. J2P1-59]